MKKYIIGNIHKIIYQSNSSPYKVGIFKVRETNDEDMEEFINKTISFTGSFTEINEDIDYTFYGKVSFHPKYGQQYNVENYEIKEPNDTESLILYLSSGMFKGIGLKTAKKIVEAFGDNTIDIIKNKYHELSKVYGITLDKAKYMHDKMVNNDMNQDLILKLNSYGFSVREAIDLINIYSTSLLSVIENNVYDLTEYVSFDKLDLIYLKNNDEFDIVRIKSLIKNVIYQMCYESGDTLVRSEEVFISMKRHFKGLLTSEQYLNVLDSLLKTREVISYNDFICLKDFFDTENLIIANINRLNGIKNVVKKDKIDLEIEWYEKENNIKFNETQKTAVKESIANNFYIITGGPGTGKTTIIKAIVDIMCKKDYRVDDITLLAPTGRSAKRMMEMVKVPAYTIHKFLKWNKETNEFQVNESNKSMTKVVIVDETSMIDIFLFSSLLKGLLSNVKLILVGDANQLPSIGPGDILNNLLGKEHIKKTILNEIFRVKEGSYITYLSRDIKDKKEVDSFDKKYDDFRFIESNDDQIMEYLIQICNKSKEKKIDLDNFQVLAPMYKGQNGIDNLNRTMQSIFNKDNKGYFVNNTEYRVNDKVIQLVNDMDNNVYNGDIGYILSIEYVEKKLVIEIDYCGNIVEYKSGEFDKFSLAYAISIHKSQGSEYDNVVVILSRSFNRMFYNKLIYTAVTRAKKSLIILGNTESFNTSVRTLYASNRETLLKYV